MKQNKTRPTCKKVHKLYIRRPCKCDHIIEGLPANKTLLPTGLTVFGRVEAGVLPERLIEVANIYECDSDGQSTGVIYRFVPYSCFSFMDS